MAASGGGLLTIPAIAIEQSDLGEPWDTVAIYLNWTIWLAFLGEALPMLRVVDDRWKWCATTRWRLRSSS